MNGNAISNSSAASSGGLCPSIDPCWVGKQVRWQSHPLERGAYILDDTFFTVLQRGVFDTKAFLNFGHLQRHHVKGRALDNSQVACIICFSQCGVERSTQLIQTVKCEPLNMRGCFTFGRINSLSSYHKSLLHGLLSKTRHCHPFALLFLLISICFSYPLTAKMICSSVLPLLPLPHPVRLHTKSTIFPMPLNLLQSTTSFKFLQRGVWHGRVKSWLWLITFFQGHCCLGNSNVVTKMLGPVS